MLPPQFVFLLCVQLIDSSFYLLFFHLQLPALAPNIFFCFSNHQEVVFFFLLLLLPSYILQQHHEEENFFSEYDQFNGFFYVGCYLEVSSPMRLRTCSVTFSGNFISSMLLQHHISKFSKYFRSKFLNVQVTELYIGKFPEPVRYSAHYGKYLAKPIRLYGRSNNDLHGCFLSYVGTRVQEEQFG